MGRSISLYLKLRGIRIIIYIDDILILSRSYEQCLIDAQLLDSLGFMIKTKKSISKPSQQLFYLGYLWNTLEMTCTLPPEKLDNIKFYCRAVLQEQFFTVKLLLVLNGVIQAARPAVNLARAMARGLQEMILMKVSLTAWARENVTW